MPRPISARPLVLCLKSSPCAVAPTAIMFSALLASNLALSSLVNCSALVACLSSPLPVLSDIAVKFVSVMPCCLAVLALIDCSLGKAGRSLDLSSPPNQKSFFL